VHFINPKDYPYLEELIQEDMLSMHQMHQMRQPEEGHLVDVLLDNHTMIDNKAWIQGMIRIGQGKIIRFNAPATSPQLMEELDMDGKSLENLARLYIYPLFSNDDSIWVGILRPDTFREDLARKIFVDFKDIFYAALTPQEAVQSLQVLRQFYKQKMRAQPRF
jgi:hypothetical protein